MPLRAGEPKSARERLSSLMRAPVGGRARVASIGVVSARASARADVIDSEPAILAATAAADNLKTNRI